MIVTLAPTQIKAVCGITDSEFDDSLDDLRNEWQPVLEASVLPEALADAELTPILQLAFTEAIAGEFFARQARADAIFETITLEGLKLSPPTNFLDPTGLIARAYSRLRPYLKPEAFSGSATVRTGGHS